MFLADNSGSEKNSKEQKNESHYLLRQGEVNEK